MHSMLDAISSTGADDVILEAWKHSGKLSLVSTGNGLPVIDLGAVSEDVCSASHGCDLIVLEGMGRSIETNLNAVFRVDCVNLGVIKHEEVAERLGASLYDCCCRFKEKEGSLQS